MDRMKVHNPEEEALVIGTLLTYSSYTADREITEDYFYTPKYALVLKAIKAIQKKGETADVVSVATYFVNSREENAPQPWEIASMSDTVIHGGEEVFKQHVIHLYELMRRRKLWKAAVKAQAAGESEAIDLDETIKELQEAMEDVEDKQGVTDMAKEVTELQKLVNGNRTGTTSPAINTGFAYLDRNLTGFHPGDLIVIGAESSQGKTGLAVTMAANIAQQGHPVAFYSMEMTAQQLTARVMAQRAGVSASRIMYSPLTSEEVTRFEKAKQGAARLPIYYDDRSTTSIDRIISSIRTNARHRNIKVAFIDYIQILGRNQKVTNTEDFYGEVARRLKNLAKEIGIVIVALSQLNRARENGDPTPTDNRLRASGQIREAADNVIMIYRPEVYGKRYKGRDFENYDPHDTAQLIISKGRNIGTGSCIVGFKPELTYFYDLTGQPPIIQKGGTSQNDDTPF